MGLQEELKLKDLEHISEELLIIVKESMSYNTR